MKTVILLFVLLLPCFAVAQDNKQAQKDSLRALIAHTTDGKEKMDAYGKLTNIYYFEATGNKQKRDTLMALYDEMEAEAEKLGNDKARGVMRINRLNILVTTQQYDEVIKLAPDYLRFMDTKQMWNSYYYIYYSLVNAYRNKGSKDEATAAVNEMYQHAKEKDNNIGMGIALFTMSRIYNDQDRLLDQEKCLREAIVVMKDSALNKLVDVYLHLGSCLVEQERYEEAVQIAGEMEKTIKRYEEESGAVMPNAWLNQYMIYIFAYVELKQYDKAGIYCDKVEHMSNGTIIPYAARAAILASHGQYAEALKMADKAIETAYPKYKLKAMTTKMNILLKTEGNKSTEKLFEDIIDLQISEHNERMNAQLDGIRTQYEVDKHVAEKERQRNYFLFTLGGCALLSIVLGIWIYYSRTIVRKNRGLYRQIKEQDRLADELEAMTRQYEQMRQLTPPPAEIEHTQSLPGSQQQRQLVSRLREYLLKDNYFTALDFDIQEIISKLATNRTSLFEAIKVVTGKSLLEFINSLRLDEAKRLLDNSELTIVTIAMECGFSTSRTFYRQFRERYRITPTEYRKMVKIND